MADFTIKPSERRKVLAAIADIEDLHTPKPNDKETKRLVIDHTPYNDLHEDNAGDPREFCPLCRQLFLVRDLKALLKADGEGPSIEALIADIKLQGVPNVVPSLK